MSNTPLPTSNPYSPLSTSYPTISTTLRPGGGPTYNSSNTTNTFIPLTFSLFNTSNPSGTSNPSNPQPLCGMNCGVGFVNGRDSSGSCVCVPVPSNTSSPFTSTPSSTSNPSNLTTTKPPGPNRDIGAIDLNGYIRLAIHSMVNNQHASAMNFTNLATNVQTSSGNGVGVAMLGAANQYIQAIMNPLLNNFDVPSENLSSIAIYFLVGTILCLSYMKNGLSLKGVYDPNIQNSLLALNTSPPNITNATKSLNNAINAATVANNTQVVNMLQQILAVVENYTSSSVKNLPLTPLQLCLTDFPLVLIFLDGYPMKFSSVNNYSLLWGGLQNQDQIKNQGQIQNQGQGQGGVENDIQDPVQEYLVSRAVLNGAMNDLVNYLSTKNDYQKLISNIQQIQNSMNTI